MAKSSEATLLRHDLNSTCIALSTGINMVKRKLAAHDNLKIIIEQTGDKFSIKESSAFRTLDLDFTLGVKFEYSLADGTELAVSITKDCLFYSHPHSIHSITLLNLLESIRS